MLSVSAPPSKPLLIWDGECNFCRRWIHRWQAFTQDKIDYAISQEVRSRFPQIPPDHWDQSVQLIETDGKVYQGAAAVFKALSYASKKKWLYPLYQKVPAFRGVSEWFYAQVASNRVLFSKLTWFLWGDHLEPSTYQFSSWLFVKWLGVIYFIAFVSFAYQARGLVGAQGLIPMEEYLNMAKEYYGKIGFLNLPTLFWLNSSDGMLLTVGGLGILSSMAVIVGIARPFFLFLCWLFYLSYMNVGQDFTSFQWDSLLLEAGFITIFFVPWQIKAKSRLAFWNAPDAIRMLYFLLLFKLMYLSGAAKLQSGDPTWRDLTALKSHYETQPLPTWVAWVFHQAPLSFHKLSVLVVFFVELIVPFMIWMPRRLRHTGAFFIILFQILIMLTGNYCFFNLLAIGLCFLLIDDWSWPHHWFKEASLRGPVMTRVCPRVFQVGLLMISLLMTVSYLARPSSWPNWLNHLKQKLRPFHTFNAYGLFAVMTQERSEIILEGSYNRIGWEAYEFKYKPGDLSRNPKFNMPHQPRLDWQMWFAALSSSEENPWLERLCQNLLQGNPEVLKLLQVNPFPENPPRYLRAVIYDYHFSDFETLRKTGHWWIRERRGLYMPVISLKHQ